MDEPLLAEHGFAALIDLDGKQRVLWDAGMTRIALRENMERMQIDPASIDQIALSHGHGDHAAAMTEIIQAICGRPQGKRWDKGATADEIDAWTKGRRVPLIAHPAAFRERWKVQPDGTKYGPVPAPPRAEWEAAGADIVLSEGPHQLAPGCWTTGAVPRRSFEQAGTSPNRAYRAEGSFIRDRLEDDQAILLNVKGKGLVVLSGCAHAGIVNTVNYAREISAVEGVWAVLGGFHLAPADSREVQRTIDALKATAPALVAPTHCTGFEAARQFADQMPDAFVLNVVGTTYLF
jgi:7,8-dihydropterin-6-yl-methyl-4-(beta-D-ribofuranosyl)aminobenzene 5'-phosphate synthase